MRKKFQTKCAKTIKLLPGVKAKLKTLATCRGDMTTLMRLGIEDVVSRVESGELSELTIWDAVSFETGTSFNPSSGLGPHIHLWISGDLNDRLDAVAALMHMRPTDVMRYAALMASEGRYKVKRERKKTLRSISPRWPMVHFRSLDDHLIDAVSHPSLGKAIATYTIQAVDAVRSGAWSSAQVAALKVPQGKASAFKARHLNLPPSVVGDMDEIKVNAGLSRPDFLRLATRLMLQDLGVWEPPPIKEVTVRSRSRRKTKTDLVITYDPSRYIELYAVTDDEITTLDGAPLADHNGDADAAVKVLKRFQILSWAAERVAYPGDYTRAAKAVSDRVKIRRDKIEVYRNFKTGRVIVRIGESVRRTRWRSEGQVSNFILATEQAWTPQRTSATTLKPKTPRGRSRSSAPTEALEGECLRRQLSSLGIQHAHVANERGTRPDLSGYVKMTLRWSGEWR